MVKIKMLASNQNDSKPCISLKYHKKNDVILVGFGKQLSLWQEYRRINVIIGYSYREIDWLQYNVPLMLQA